MNLKAILNFLIFSFLIFFTSCNEEKDCASIISEMAEAGVDLKDLSRVLNFPVSAIKNPHKHQFSQNDSLFIISIYRTYCETGKLPKNLYSLYNKNNRQQLLTSIENYRNQELQGNQAFISKLSRQIIELQQNNLNDFIENEINSFKAIRFAWKNQTEINNELTEALPKYINEIEVAKVFNDSCASYFLFISKFRKNGIVNDLKNNPKNVNKAVLHIIGTDISGFSPTYDYNPSSSDITYQTLATIDRAQDILFTPVNWFLELLPGWLMITISCILLIFFIICLYAKKFTFGIIDVILLLISVIVLIWGDPYSDIRKSLNEQVAIYYDNKVTNELILLNSDTNHYYDNIIKNVRRSSNTPRTTYNVVQTSNQENGQGSHRTNCPEFTEGDDRTITESISQIDIEKNDSIRN